MYDPFPQPDERSGRARTLQRLLAAVDAAIQDGHKASLRGPQAATLAQPYLQRLEQIRLELVRLKGVQSGWDGEETHPFWIELLNSLGTQTPCAKSPPPENISR